MRVTSAVAVVAAIFILHRAPAAQACSFPPPLWDRQTVPATGETNIPLNAQIRAYYGSHPYDSPPDMGQLSLRPIGGKSIAATTTTIENPEDMGLLVILRPAAPLLPSTTYELLDTTQVPCEDFWDSCVLDAPAVIASFTTGTTEDTTAPLFGGLTGFSENWEECDNDACCGPYAGFYIGFGRDPDTLSDNGPIAHIRWNVYRSDLDDPIAYASNNVVGFLSCIGGKGPYFFTGLHAADGQSYILRAVDLAGNEDTNTSIQTIMTTCADAPDPDAGITRDAAGDDPLDASPPDGAGGGGKSGSGSGCGCRVSSRESDAGSGSRLLLAAAVLVFTVRRRNSH